VSWVGWETCGSLETNPKWRDLPLPNHLYRKKKEEERERERYKLKTCYVLGLMGLSISGLITYYKYYYNIVTLSPLMYNLYMVITEPV